MKILAIETSCDDTAIAILKINGKTIPRFSVLANIVSSQIKIHAKYGGVYPFLAKREHQKNLPVVLKKALKKAGLLNAKDKTKNEKKFIDIIAVTVGPGLEPCLWTGINFAKKLAEKLKTPIVPVNHIESHILVNFLDTKYKALNAKHLFPAICLIVSGGHTQLILMKNFGQYKILGETRDDAAGECFDKTARILGLSYPGGPNIAKIAAQCKTQNKKYKIQLPRPMIHQKNYDFSFSGLKTAVLYQTKSTDQKEIKKKGFIQEMSQEIQQAIIDVLIKKTLKAAKDFKIKTIILGGGVASNNELRKQLKEKIKKGLPNIKCLMPDVKCCVDNAVMTAVTAYFNLSQKIKEKEIKAMANLRIKNSKHKINL